MIETDIDEIPRYIIEDIQRKMSMILEEVQKKLDIVTQDFIENSLKYQNK